MTETWLEDTHFKKFPQFFVIHTVQGLGIINKAEVHVLLELSHFFDYAVDIGKLISGFSANGIFQARILEWVAIAFSIIKCMRLLSENIDIVFSLFFSFFSNFILFLNFT